MNMDKLKNKVFFWAFAGLWGALILWNALSPTQTFSEAENRALAGIPPYSTEDLLDGDFMDGMNTFFNDQFPARPMWVGGQTVAEYALGKREINRVYMGRGALFSDYAPENPNVSGANIEGVNAFAERYQMPTTVMLVPSSTWVQRSLLPAFTTPWDEQAYIQSAYGGLSPAVGRVDAAAVLDAHKDEYVYYRTDHHWTTYGAYLAYQKLAVAMGLPVRGGADMSVQTVSTDFYGTNHSKTSFPFLKADVVQRYQAGTATGFETYGVQGGSFVTNEYPSIFFDEYLQTKDQYSYFLGPLQAYVTIHTGSNSGKKLIVFKDSYAHCLAPMLMEEYSEIRLVDLRAFKADDYGAFVNVEDYDEALFLYSADTFAHELGPAYFA